MKELDVICNLQSPQEKNTKIIININNNDNSLLYKYIVGCNGTWNTLKDFSYERSIEWIPKEDGKYIVMVQGKKKDSGKNFEYLSKLNYIVGKIEEQLINNVSIDNSTLQLGDKFSIFVEASKVPLMFRYWIRVNDKWEIIKDYSAENTISWVAKDQGKCEILVECKNIDSKNNFDDFQSIQFEVLPLRDVQVLDFKCITEDILKDEDIIFKVDTSYEKGRTILYKFIKINSNGEAECIQDYSTNSTVIYKESISGNYRLLCLVKDMYSNRQFDDRAVINFDVKKYKDIFIKSFTTDLNSPQISDTDISLKAEVTGGKELFYRYIIKGEHSEDSGYTRNNTYIWRSKVPGNYNITIWVKDKSFEGNYEACDSIHFIIDEKSKEPVNIKEIFMDNPDRILKNETVQITVNASGGTELKYAFIIKKDGREVQKVKYGKCNWIKFIPVEKGYYEIETRVKDKYSTREFDCHTNISVEVFNYIPANIDYILFPSKDHYVVGDKINLNLITQNTKNTLINYVLRINNHKVEETSFVNGKKYTFVPKCSGTYTIEFYAKNIESDEIFDSKKEATIEVHESIPITNTKINFDKVNVSTNEFVTFNVSCNGGKDVLYEFYIMEKGEWYLAQNYSKKSYYTFMPFSKDNYKILALSKSQYYEGAYEDYDIVAFTVG